MLSVSDRNRLVVAEHLNSMLKENQSNIMKLANSQLSMTKELQRYAILLNIINFERINRALRFMSNQDYKNFYTRGEVYRNLVKEHNVDVAWVEINALARSEIFADDQILREDETLELGKCVSSVARIDRAKDLLFAQFEGRVRLDSELNMMLVRLEDKSIVTIDDYDRISFAHFISLLLLSLSSSEADSVIKKLEARQSSKSRENVIIQFNDCYVEDGIVKSGMYEAEDLPRFFINRNVYDAVKSKQPTVSSEAVDQLILHLCNFDERIRDRVFAVMSTVFLNSKKLKTRFNVSPRIYGKDGANGKTTFTTLLENAFGTRNVKAVSISELDNERTVYTAANALIALDSDSTGKMISDDAASNFKSLTSGEMMKIRGLFKNEEQVKTSCMMIALSNMLPASSDKSAAYLRRLEISRCDYQLTNDESKLGPNSKCTLIDLTDEFFDELYSDNAAQYLIESLLIESQRLRKDGFLPPKPKTMNDIIEKFAEDNDSAAAFVLDVGLEKVIGYSVSHVKQIYSDWCEENDMTELKRKFNETLEDRYGLVRKVVNIAKNIHEDDKSFAQSIAKPAATVRAWQFADHKKNEEFFNRVKDAKARGIEHLDEVK